MNLWLNEDWHLNSMKIFSLYFSLHKTFNDKIHNFMIDFSFFKTFHKVSLFFMQMTRQKIDYFLHISYAQILYPQKNYHNNQARMDRFINHDKEKILNKIPGISPLYCLVLRELGSRINSQNMKYIYESDIFLKGNKTFYEDLSFIRSCTSPRLG